MYLLLFFFLRYSGKLRWVGGARLLGLWTFLVRCTYFSSSVPLPTAAHFGRWQRREQVFEDRTRFDYYFKIYKIINLWFNDRFLMSIPTKHPNFLMNFLLKIKKPHRWLNHFCQMNLNLKLFLLSFIYSQKPDSSKWCQRQFLWKSND